MALTEAQLAKLTELKHLQSVATRLKGAIDTLSADAIKTVKVNGTALTVNGNAVDILVAVEKKQTANTGYAASYSIKANGVSLSPDIDIPKDFLVKSATLETSTAQNFEEVGCSAAGKKYIDFVINTVDDDTTASHIYLPVEDLVDVYTAGNGLTVSNNEFSLVIDSSNANGLSVGANGLAMAVATDSVTGAMSSADHAQFTADSAKLADISTQANKTTVTTEKAGTIEIDGVTKTIVDIATDAEVAEMLDAILPALSNG